MLIQSSTSRVLSQTRHLMAKTLRRKRSTTVYVTVRTTKTPLIANDVKKACRASVNSAESCVTSASDPTCNAFIRSLYWYVKMTATRAIYTVCHMTNANSAHVRQVPRPQKKGAFTRQNCCPHWVKRAMMTATARNTNMVTAQACRVHTSERNGSPGQSKLG